MEPCWFVRHSGEDDQPGGVQTADGPPRLAVQEAAVVTDLHTLPEVTCLSPPHNSPAQRNLNGSDEVGGEQKG